MHGIVHAELQKFVLKHHGRDAWRAVLAEAECGSTVYLVSRQYPDAEMSALMRAASRLTGVPAEQLLEQFGAFMVPGLLSLYGSLVPPHWRTLDLLEHTEKTMHHVVRLRNPTAQPPRLRCERVSPTEVSISYGSERKLCAVAKGLIRGIADHYGDTIVVAERTCMHRGAARCEISTTLTSPAPALNRG